MVSVSLSISAGLAIILGLVVLVWPKGLRIGLGLWLLLFGVLQFLSF